MDHRLEPFHQFWIALPEFIKCYCMLLEYPEDGIRVVTVLELGSKWVIDEIIPRLFSVVG